MASVGMLYIEQLKARAKENDTNAYVIHVDELISIMKSYRFTRLVSAEGRFVLVWLRRASMMPVKNSIYEISQDLS